MSCESGIRSESRSDESDFGRPFFVYAYPKEIKAFYCKTYRNNPELAMSADLLVPNVGEITTGGSRVDEKDELIARMKELIGDPEVQYSNSPDELYADIKKVTVDAGGGINGPKHPGNIRTTNFPMYPNLQQK